MSSTSHSGARRRAARCALLLALIAAAATVAVPSTASAAQCPVVPVNATSWIGGSGSFNDDLNWTNGGPSAACDVSIVAAGNYTVTMTAGANAKSLTLGGAGSTPTLVISAQSPNTNLDAQPAGITIAAGASVVLTCPAFGCLGGLSGGAGLVAGSSPLLNAGTIKVDSSSGTGAAVNGAITNTGTMSFENSGTVPFEKTTALGGKIVNKGVISMADGATVVNQGASCGDPTASVKNDAGGTITGTGSGLLSVRNFEQGDGASEDVLLPCGGTLDYSGDGASQIRATGGFNLEGEMQAGQNLTISAESNNTIASLQSDFTNKGAITLTCPALGCSGSGGGPGGGAGFNAGGKAFTNAGSFTVDGSAGTDTSIDSGGGGTITNTGTMSFSQSAFLRGVAVNKGKLNIADGKTVTSPAESCGNTGPRVINDSGGSINATGSGFLSVINYEQGNGTTSGAVPVQIPCGTLKYTGTGAATVQVNAPGTPLTGNLAAGQTLRLLGGVNDSSAFTNAGTIVFDQSATSPNLNAAGVTNTGKIELVGPSGNSSSVTGGQLEQTGAGAEIVVPAGTKLSPSAPIALEAGTLRGGGTVSGSVENTGGVVKPGSSPGALTLSGSYLQGSSGRLEIEVGGTGAGQFDALSLGGSAGLDGTLALIPVGGFADSSAVGDSVSFLTYGGSLTGGFATTTVSPALACGKAFSTSSDTGAKALKATVVAGGTACPPTTPPPSSPPPKKDPVPDTKLNLKPKAVVKTTAAKAKVKVAFTSPNVKGATFQCKLDKSAYKSCSSPKTYKLKPGKHTFSVRAVGPGGTDPSPATVKVKVVKAKG